MRLSCGGGRREGKSTVLIDVAIVNALMGERVWFWHDSFQAADHNFVMATNRLINSGLAKRFRAHAGSLTLRTMEGNGEIRFTAQDPQRVMGPAEFNDTIMLTDNGSAISEIRIPDRLTGRG